MLELKNNHVVLQVREDLGAAISRYDFIDGQAIFRAAPEGSDLPFKMACNLLIPWCNRISDGGFSYDGVFHPLAPNIEGEDCPLHGDAFLKPWTCISQSDTVLTLELVSTIEPFQYRAEVTYRLDGTDLVIDLSVSNLSEVELPYGMGLHPWFEQDEDTEIQLDAEQVILSNKDNLPVKTSPISEQAECFTGWNQQAILTWPSRNMSVKVQADNAFSECHVYTMSRQNDFFCVEPVTHPVNTHNWPDSSQRGLQRLKKGDTMTASCRFSPKLGDV